MGSKSCFSKNIADVFPPWHRVNTHLNAPDQQTDKTIEVLTLTDDQLMKYIWSAALAASYHLNSMEAVKMYFIFQPVLLNNLVIFT